MRYPIGVLGFVNDDSPRLCLPIGKATAGEGFTGARIADDVLDVTREAFSGRDSQIHAQRLMGVPSRIHATPSGSPWYSVPSVTIEATDNNQASSGRRVLVGEVHAG